MNTITNTNTNTERIFFRGRALAWPCFSFSDLYRTKSIFLALFCFFLSAPLLSTNINAETKKQKKMRVFACEEEWASLAKEIGGELLDVYSATTAYEDPHHVSARPSLIAKVLRTDLIFCTGASLEIGWLPLLLSATSEKKFQEGGSNLFYAATSLKLLDVPSKSLNKAMGDIHIDGNPHFFTDPRKLFIIAKRLSERLAAFRSKK